VNLYIFNDPEYKGPKKINFKKAVDSLPKNINVQNLFSNSKTYYDEEKLKSNILEIHKKEFMSALFSKKVYIVEGINDQLFLKKLLMKTGKQFEQYSIFPCYGKPHYFPFVDIFNDLGINTVLLFDEDKVTNETNNNINIELQKNKYYMFSENLEKELGYNISDKGNLPKFLDYLSSYNDYEKYFTIVED
ncbi:MAG: ATP-dependent endonuclease, partial [Tenericutes bacterium]|nr:ATP-dependent endonuclease [Mycoplasmatota bacterium]